MSPISSSRSVPVLESSKQPWRGASAPVKAPFSWPNSSLSIKLSGRDRAVHGHEGTAERGLRSWMRRATNSLPVRFRP